MTETSTENAAGQNQSAGCPEVSNASATEKAGVGCNSISGVNRFVRMGTNTFFLPNIGEWNYDFLVNYYDIFYSINGIRLNRSATIEKYKRKGVLKSQFINPRLERINFAIVRNCNAGYSGLSNVETAEKIFREGICTDIIIDNVPESQCGEASPSFPILDIDFTEGCDEDSGNLTTESCNEEYNFFTDIFDWQFCIFCNQEIQRSGYTGCEGCIEWFITRGVFQGAYFNKFKNYIDLNFVACANNLTQLRTFRQVNCWFFTYGVCDPEVLYSVPNGESCVSSQITPYNYAKTSRIARILSEFIKKECTSAEGANSLSTCNSAVQTTFNPDAEINWASYGSLLTTPINLNNISYNYYPTTTSTNNYPPTSSTAPASQFPTLATRGTYNSLNERAKIEAEQLAILARNPNFNPLVQRFPNFVTNFTTNNPRLTQYVTGGGFSPNFNSNIDVGANGSFISFPANDSGRVSFGSANVSAGANPTNTCPTCVTQYNAYTPVNQPVNYITPLSLTLNPTPRSLNGSLGNSLLLSNSSFNSNGTINSNTVAPSAYSILNGTAGIGGGLIAGGFGNGSRTNQTYYNTGKTKNFYSPNSANLAYFS